ncbi:hypothetical protein [Fictibacillus phosphorivorans]|uniref:hypothetical protein n=1 Tax=Fictibacillus phosphorivorans TaxID=1221500 RepID=UPI002041530F|nr:hypothetical protein [Fictibacillus phosphorivorans]MCM3719306.1 hypothetical protein [Fictibacillus phosphorivorans]MCM3776928.1 hypothetical protein [Fictibacillus phosphorivorans]
MNFYIASGFTNKKLVQKLSKEIQIQLGWNDTYDWTVNNEKADAVEKLTEIGIKEMKGV